MKLLRTIRFDASDDRVFERAAGPDEWAVPGAFAFARLAPDEIAGKTRQAFANGFLSLESYGRASFVTVAEIADADHARLATGLAEHLVADYGAPDVATAMPAAREELAFASDLAAGAPVNTVLAVSRSLDDDGRIREAFRRVTPPGEAPHARIWDVVAE